MWNEEKINRYKRDTTNLEKIALKITNHILSLTSEFEYEKYKLEHDLVNLIRKYPPVVEQCDIRIDGHAIVVEYADESGYGSDYLAIPFYYLYTDYETELRDKHKEELKLIMENKKRREEHKRQLESDKIKQEEQSEYETYLSLRRKYEGT
jgi:hypothetical protein